VALAAAAAILNAGCGPGGGDSSPPSADGTAPSVPSGVAALAASPSRIDLTWLASTDDVGVTGYVVRRAGAVVGTPTATAFAEQGLSASTRYCYTVAARDAAGNESAPGAPACATTPPDTTAPSVPAGVAAAASSARIDLTWLASTDDVGVTGYVVRRGATVLGTPGAPAFAEQGLSPSTRYCYTVSARDAAQNESAESPPACVTTLADTTAPATPGGLAAQAVSPARVELAFTASTDDVGVAGYRVFRGGVAVATTPSSPWVDPTRSPQATSCYAVSAFDAAGNESAPSGEVCATTPRRPVPATGHLAMALTDGGDGTVTDGVTGLVWQQAIQGPANWYEATGTPDASLNPFDVDVCGTLVLGGFSGWRLPTDAELLDVTAHDLSPAIDPALFPAAPPPNDFFWSSTSLDAGKARIWFQALGWLGAGAKGTPYAVRCVLGGPGLGPRPAAAGDGTVVDASTGLTWQQGDGGVRPHDGPTGATAYCAGLALAGGGWRLPTVKEAKSLAPIDAVAFPGTAAEPFWTSTPVFAGGWWWVEPVGGQVYYEALGAPQWTRCVRGP
jgi:hypothetical protein